MGFQKFQKVEKTDVVSPEGHDVIADSLSKIGKASMAETTPAERQEIAARLEVEES